MRIGQIQVVAALRRACEDAGSQREWAEAHGYSPDYVSQILGGKKPPSENMANKLGIVVLKRYERAA